MAADPRKDSEAYGDPSVPDEIPRGMFNRLPSPGPTPRTHRIRLGDTLSKLALDYHVTVESLVAANRIQGARLLWVGQVLTIPQKAAPTRPQTAPAPYPASPTPPRAQSAPAPVPLSRRNEVVPRHRAKPSRSAFVVSTWVTVKKVSECIAGEMTSATKTALIILEDQGYTGV
ncbi:LysM peptidoglycan-binding domain-containing protein [Cystobacter fuscus]|uniref:LysM peptidoglycan-binding domain-containing protein n=1 Tax=Cystobacter fuscus TaxID=43 RepID=UPI002B2CF65A|nr:LysM peptidoglycan-binding domain-containing protein [Cystobacter fuscus]